jgi:GntR family transcriptional regulator/MocR family aminotransferase
VPGAVRAAGAVRVGVEDPCHRWRTRAGCVGIEVGIPTDEHGLRVDALGDVDAVLVSPDHNFPTGVVLSPDRRSALVDWAAAGDRLVIEDDHDGHFRYGGIHAGALQALAPEHVAYVGSASALLAPAVRLGWAVLPARLVAPVADRLFVTALATSRLMQFALAEMIEQGYLDRHLRRSCLMAARGAPAVAHAVLSGCEVGGAPVGLFVPVRMAGEGLLLYPARNDGSRSRTERARAQPRRRLGGPAARRAGAQRAVKAPAPLRLADRGRWIDGRRAPHLKCRGWSPGRSCRRGRSAPWDYAG